MPIMHNLLVIAIRIVGVIRRHRHRKALSIRASDDLILYLENLLGEFLYLHINILSVDDDLVLTFRQELRPCA
jgi:hypothetical protein